MAHQEQSSVQQNAELLPTEKRCCKCKIAKSKSDFGSHKAKPDGLRVECKLCRMTDSAKVKMLYIKPKNGFKHCSVCAKELPLSNNYFFNNSKLSTGFDCACKNCMGYKSPIAKHTQNGEKICSKCKTPKPCNTDFFNKQPNKIDNLRPECKDCQREVRKKYYLENKRELRIKGREAHQKFKKKRAVTQKIWNDNNKGKVRHYKRKRKERVLMATPNWFDKKKVEMIYQKAVDYEMEVDHIVPIKSDLVCGLHTWENMQILTKDLNRSKSNVCWPDMP